MIPNSFGDFNVHFYGFCFTHVITLLYSYACYCVEYFASVAPGMMRDIYCHTGNVCYICLYILCGESDCTCCSLLLKMASLRR